MAERIKDFQFTHGNTKYPWDEWLDGSIWRLRRGEDFACKLESFRVAAISGARVRGLSLRTCLVGDDEVVIQALVRDGKRQ